MEIQVYNLPAKILHWVMAILIIFIIGLGLFMVDLPKGSDERSYYFVLHKSVGLTLFLLVFFRLGWRLIKNPPPLPECISVRRRKLAALTHGLLYVLMFVQPFFGYISSSFSGYETKFWGIALPHWGWKNPELNELFTEIHEIGAFCLITLIFLHIAGTIYHVYKKEREFFKRMWF